MSDKYLFDEEPKSFSPTLAKALGSVSKAVIMQQIHFWIKHYAKKRDKSHFFKGFYWVFNSYAEWHKDLDFIPLPTMKRQILALEKDGLLISDDFNKNRGNRTKWYRIDYEKLTALTDSVSASDQNELASDQNELASDQNELASDQNDPLCQSDHHIDQQNDQQKEILEQPLSFSPSGRKKKSEPQNNISSHAQNSDPNIQDPQTPKPLSPAAPENIGKPVKRSPSTEKSDRRLEVDALLADDEFRKFLFERMKKDIPHYLDKSQAEYELHTEKYLAKAFRMDEDGDERIAIARSYKKLYDRHKAEQVRIEQERLERELERQREQEHQARQEPSPEWTPEKRKQIVADLRRKKALRDIGVVV